LAEFHILPIKTDLYLGDTRHLTAAQHGAYFLLLMMAWRSPGNDLPNNDDTLARWACMDRRTWLRNRDVVMAFWVLGPDARWRQKRLDETRKYVGDLVNKKSAAGQASALKRKETGSTPVQQAPQQNGSSQSQSQSEIKLAGECGIQAEEELPSSWHTYAEGRGIPDEQIYQSWRKFKDKTSYLPLSAAELAWMG
jgi:uncharacterized protein YdaU (DUF1376 family)